MRRRYIRIALFVSVPHWVIARTLPAWKVDPKTAAAAVFAKVYGR